jgi:FPC/CPF motif-containing protein YcgG
MSISAPVAEDAYAVPSNGHLLLPDETPAPEAAVRVHSALRALVLDPQFPCVGARSAFNQESYRFALYGELGAQATTDALAHDLARFADEASDISGDFASFVTCYEEPKVLDQAEFEYRLWRQLEALNARDMKPWDDAVSSDPSDPKFSFSFNGRAFFVVGLQPSGPRWARTFPWPTLVFNPHDQFERLREGGKFQRIQDVIRERDTELQGDINPNLSNFGEHTEARQYSGREVGDDWRCPVTFHAKEPTR